MFSISGKLRNSDVSDFRKLRTPTFPISGNSGLWRFPRFLYYVILLVSCLHPSLVTPSAVGNTSLSLDPQFPLALLYCFRLCNSDPILCTWYNFIPFLSYKYLYSVARIIRIKITIIFPFLSSHSSSPSLYSLLVSGSRNSGVRKFPRSLAFGNPGSLRDSTGNRAIPWVHPGN